MTAQAKVVRRFVDGSPEWGFDAPEGFANFGSYDYSQEEAEWGCSRYNQGDRNWKFLSIDDCSLVQPDPRTRTTTELQQWYRSPGHDWEPFPLLSPVDDELSKRVLATIKKDHPEYEFCIVRKTVTLEVVEEAYKSATESGTFPEFGHIAVEFAEQKIEAEELLRESEEVIKELSGNLVLHDRAYQEREWLPKMQAFMSRVRAFLNGGAK